MGADLVGYILKGPAELDDGRIEAAKQFLVEQSQALAPFLLRLQEEKVFPAGLQESEYFCEDDLYDPEDLDEVLEYLQDCVFENNDPTDYLDDFVSMWVNGDVRDVACRLDPDDRSQQLLFCGDMSWGDEPEGYGYELIQRARTLGLLLKLNIR